MTQKQFLNDYDFILSDLLRDICKFEKVSIYSDNVKIIKKLCLKNIKKYKKQINLTLKNLLKIHISKIRDIAHRFQTIQFKESIEEVQKSIIIEQNNLIKQLEEYLN